MIEDDATVFVACGDIGKAQFMCAGGGIGLGDLGGIAGIALAYGLCVWLATVVGAPFTFDPKINGIAFVFSAAIGILFGFMPARRAAGLDPIDALRHE